MMDEEDKDQSRIENFKVESVFEDRVHERYAFTFTVEDHALKGHFHENQIQWLHPHPKQLIEEEKVDAIESVIYKLMVEYGISTDTEAKELEIKPVFKDKAYKRHQFTLKVDGEQFKGFVHESEIKWFHPQPKQKLEDEKVEAIETEIHEKLAEFKKEENEQNSGTENN